MNDSVTKPETVKKHQLGVNEAMLAGQIQSVRKINTQEGPRYLTLLRLPAANEYLYPATVEVSSDEPIGQKGDNVTQHVRTGGTPNSYETTQVDRNTGDQIKQTVRTARNQYVAIQI